MSIFFPTNELFYSTSKHWPSASTLSVPFSFRNFFVGMQTLMPLTDHLILWPTLRNASFMFGTINEHCQCYHNKGHGQTQWQMFYLS